MIFSQKEIYEKVKEQFRQRGFDVEFGSNIQQIQNSMQYLVSMLNQNTQINVKETILSSQTKRNMILEDARLLGYEAMAKVSYQYKLSLTLTNNTGVQQTITIPNQQVFTSNGNTYYYFGNPISVSLTPNGQEQIKTIEIEVKEGKMITPSDDQRLQHVIQTTFVNGVVQPESFIDIPYSSVEENGVFIEIESQDAYGNSQIDVWERNKNGILDVDETLQGGFFIRENDISTQFPRIYFKHGGLGKGLQIGDIVRTSILISKGQGGQQDTFTIENPNNTDVEIVIGSEQYITGSDEETNQSVKLNQPLFNNAQNRIITIHDYESFQKKNPLIQHAQIWDGFDEIDKIKGHIWFSFVPQRRTRILKSENVTDNPQGQPIKNEKWVLEKYTDQNNYLTSDGWETFSGYGDESDTSEVQEIFKDYRQYTVPTLVFQYREPIYLDFDIVVKMAQYNLQSPTNISNEMIFESIRKYFQDITDPINDNRIEQFKSKFFASELIDKMIHGTFNETMFDLEVNTSVMLYPRHINNDQASNKITFRIGQDFAKIIENGDVVHQGLPNIQTVNFIGPHTLQMPPQGDFLTYPDPLHASSTYDQPIKLNGLEVGRYKIIGSDKSVEITLDTSISPISTYLDNGLKINIKFPSPNIKVRKNTFPRLNSVTIEI